jgi:hypothetical protein
MLTVKRLAIAGAAIALAVGLAACGTTQTARSSAPTATTVAPPASTPTDDTFPNEGITQTSTPQVWTGKVGDTAVLSDETGDVAKVKIVKTQFSRGDEYNRPERGNFLGVYVKTQAIADGQTSLWGDIYVTMNGHHYDGDAYAEGFKPALDYVNLNTGETAEGWLVFDVPARHGQVVLSNSGDSSKIGTWSF